MSFRTSLDRTVSVVRTAAGEAEDDFGDEVVVDDDTLLLVRARRDLVKAGEDRIGRDQQTGDVTYVLERLSETGAPVVLTGRDRIVDLDGEWEIIGDPELVHRRRRPHHWQASARRISG